MEAITKIKLKYPFTSTSGKHIDVLTMRRPKVGDLLIVEKDYKGMQEREIALFALLSNLLFDDIKEMDVEDYMDLQTAFATLKRLG